VPEALFQLALFVNGVSGSFAPIFVVLPCAVRSQVGVQRHKRNGSRRCSLATSEPFTLGEDKGSEEKIQRRFAIREASHLRKPFGKV
jgi:hypothetical protein